MPKSLIHLQGVQFKNTDDSEPNMIAFELESEHKTRKYHVFNEEEAHRWEKALKIATGQSEDFLKDYKLLQKLGEGRSGVVWKAESLRSKRVYAVKCIEHKKSKKAQYEMDMLKSLKHPGIVRLHRIYECTDYYRIVEELGEKGTLRDYILNLEYLDEDQSRDIVKQLAFALCYLKRKGVLHRDIKPENVVITD